MICVTPFSILCHPRRIRVRHLEYWPMCMRKPPGQMAWGQFVTLCGYGVVVSSEVTTGVVMSSEASADSAAAISASLPDTTD